MIIPIYFSYLTYTKQGISNACFPLGISMVASYAKKRLGDKIDLAIFQYPEHLSKSLENRAPRFACFSNYSWTLDISHEFAKKIKEKSPETITVFGGPNYPIEKNEQEKFLKSYSGIDFYIKGEGEKGFIELFESLEKFNFDIKKFKQKNTKTGNCYYFWDGKIINEETLPRLENLDEIPSPYLEGLLDKFFDKNLTPTIQTSRGCPFRCTYCQEGQEYFNKITRFSPKRIKEELAYIAKRVKVPNLIITDSNFGMYSEDLETCNHIAVLKKENNWPKYIDGNLGKNKKVVFEAVNLLEGDICLSAPVQSTDQDVLKNINRKNISLERIIEIAQGGKAANANSFSEIILCLPGDTKSAHFKSMFDMIDADINVVRSHQLLMLPGSDISTRKTREKYGMKTKFRLQPRCFGDYKVYNKNFSACEIDEICISNNTMPYKDYLECRSMDLTIEIFYNNAIFQELANFLKQQNIGVSSFIKEVQNKIPKSPLKRLYNNFLKETENSLWKSKKELESFIKQPGIVERYIKEESRINEQLGYRALAFFNNMETLHKISFACARDLLIKDDNFNKEKDCYLYELSKFSLFRKNNLLSLDEKQIGQFNYDFVSLSNNKFNDNALLYKLNDNIEISFSHSDEQKELISRYIQQFGLSLNGLGTMLSKSNANKFYREIKAV